MELLEEQSIIYRQKIYNEYSKSSKASSKLKKGCKPFQLPQSAVKFLKEDQVAEIKARASKLKNQNSTSPFGKYGGSATPVSPMSP